MLRRLAILPLALTAFVFPVVPGSGSAPAGWTTYHHDPSHAGLDTEDPNMVSATLNQTSPALTGDIYAEPLVSGSTVYVATEANIVYALKASDLSVQWSTGQVDPPVPLGEVQNAAGLGGCGNIDPMGITGTPVIDPALGTSGTLFAAEETWDGSNSTPHVMHKLIKVDLATHAVTTTSVDPPGLPTRGPSNTTNTALEQQRSGLSLAGGRVIVPYGGLSGDCGAYHGYAVSAAESNGAIAGTYETVSNHTGAGMWAPSGAAVDGAGNVYLATGNGNDNSGRQDSEAVMRLDSALNRLDIWAPANWQALNSSDTDIGSVGPTLLPGGLLFQTGKQGRGYLLHQAALSANSSHVGGEAFSAQVCNSGSDASFGGNAYANGVIYMPCSDGLVALALNSTSATFSQLWYDTTGKSHPPIVAGGAVWTAVGDTLYAMAPANHAHRFSVTVAGADQNQFMTPAAGDGQVFMAGNTGGSGKVTSIAMNITPPTQLAGTVGANNGLWVLDGSNGGFSPGGGQLSAAPAVVGVRPTSGTATPVYIGTGIDHNLWESDGSGGPWVPLTTTPVYCIDNPAAVSAGVRGSGTITVACQGGDHALWAAQAALPASGLPHMGGAAWHSLGGRLLAGPAVTQRPGLSGPSYEVVGTDQQVWELNPGANQFAPRGWYCNGHPAAATNPAGSTAYFACQGTDRQLWFSTDAGSNWQTARAAGGVLVDGPGIAATPGGAVFYAEGQDGALWHLALNGSTPGTFQLDGGVIHAGAGAAGLF